MMVLVSDQSGCVEFAVYKGLSIIRKPETLAYLRWEEIIKLMYEQNGFERQQSSISRTHVTQSLLQLLGQPYFQTWFYYEITNSEPDYQYCSPYE